MTIVPDQDPSPEPPPADATHDVRELLAISAQEHALVSTTVRMVGSLWRVAQDCALGYGALADKLELAAPQDDARECERALSATVLFRAARRCALLELLDIARRHVAEAHSKRRRALDLLAFAWIAWHDPAAPSIWLEASTNWKAYHVTYGNIAVRRALESIKSELHKWHRSLSARIHPSMISLAQAVRPRDDGPASMFEVGLFDTRADEGTPFAPVAIAQHILDACFTHLEAQAAFTRLALTEAPWRAPARSAEQDLVQLRDRFDAEYRDWKTRITAWREHRRKVRARIRQEQRAGKRRV